MFWQTLLGRPTANSAEQRATADRPETHPAQASFGPYMAVADAELGLISVFDDLKYDRADADMMSPAMRRHAIARLERIGFQQVSGTVLKQPRSGRQCLIPKIHALGASPFDVARYTPKGAQDFYLLTPTQTACQIIDHYPHADAVARIKTLIAAQPINLYKLMDYLEHTPAHRDALQAIGHLKYVQRAAITSEPLMRRRALG